MRRRTRIALLWICIGAISIGLVLTPDKSAQADLFGGDLPLLAEIIAKAIEQVQELQSIIKTTGEATSILEDMNRGMKEVLRLRAIHDLRTTYLTDHRKKNWREVSLKEIGNDPRFSKIPIGPILLIADELAELTGNRSTSKQKQSVHSRISELARMARATGIHLILGTQRPDRTVIDGQIKDSMVTKLCFSVPSIAASNIVIDNMAAFTIGRHPGRAVLAKGIDRSMVQAPRLTSEKATELVAMISERLKQQNYTRRVISVEIPKASPNRTELE